MDCGTRGQCVAAKRSAAPQIAGLYDRSGILQSGSGKATREESSWNGSEKSKTAGLRTSQRMKFRHRLLHMRERPAELAEAIVFGDDPTVGGGVVVRVSGYRGFGPKNLWERLETREPRRRETGRAGPTPNSRSESDI